jgi:hypothetical protein
VVSLRSRLVAEVVFVVVAMGTVVVVAQAYGVDGLSGDLMQEYLPAARDLLHGGSPYLPSGTLTTAAGEFPYLYPPLLALLLIPHYRHSHTRRCWSAKRW